MSNFFTKTTENHVRNKITLLSFFASFLVIYGHCYNVESFGLTEESVGFGAITYNVEMYWDLICVRLAVSLFFFISGFLFFRTLELSNFKKKYFSRVRTIVIPYLLWASFYFIYYVALTHIPAISSRMNADESVDFSITNWLQWLWPNQYYTLWFLKYLMIFIAVTPLIWLLLKNHFGNKIPTGLVALIVLLVLFDKRIFCPPYMERIDSFLIGSYIGLNMRNCVFYKNRILSFISLAIIAVDFYFDLYPWNVVNQILLFLSLWFALDFIDLSEKKLPWFMYITFFTYVAHDALMQPLKKIALLLHGTNPVYGLLDYLFIPVILWGILVVVAMILQKILPRFWKVITGGR